MPFCSRMLPKRGSKAVKNDGGFKTERSSKEPYYNTQKVTVKLMDTYKEKRLENARIARGIEVKKQKRGLLTKSE